MTNWRRWFWIALCSSLLVRLLYAASLPLSNDEAYHWLWTYYPSAGYYDHPGLFAYVLWPFTALLGHDAEWVVRIPSLLAMTLCPCAVYLLARDMARDLQCSPQAIDRCSSQAGLLCMCLPLFAVLGMYHTGDASVICVWAWALLFAYRSLSSADGSWKAWLWLGVCVGLGFQAKYLFFMFVPLFGASIMFLSQFRFWMFRAQPYVALLIGLCIFAPNLYWNMQNDWATFVFNFSARHDKVFELKHVLEFLFGTLAIGISPGLYLYTVNAFAKRLTRPSAQHCWGFLAIFSLIPIAYFLYRSFGQQVGGHWPAVAYVALIVLAPLHWQSRDVTADSKTPLLKQPLFWVYTPAVLILLLVNIVLAAVSIYPNKLIQYKGDIKYSSRINSDKVNDIYGWRDLGAWIDEEHRLFNSKAPAFVCGPQYGFVAQLAFYTPSHPHVYLWESSRTHGQHFRLLDDFSVLKGQNALFVAKSPERLDKSLKELSRYFERVAVKKEILDIKIKGKLVRQFALIRCYNYSGEIPDHWR